MEGMKQMKETKKKGGRRYATVAKIDPNTHRMIVRMPLQIAARLDTAADESWEKRASLAARIIVSDMKGVKPSSDSLKWAAERVEANKRTRAKRDELAKKGCNA